MEVKSVKCLAPFMSLQFVSYGFVRSCCTSWSKLGPIGNLNQDTDILAIWNSERIQRIRKAIIEDRMETVCHMHICPHALEKKNIVLDNINTNDPNFKYLINQIKNGETKLDRPPLKILISDSGECNLSCIMCTSNNKYAKYNSAFSQNLFNEILPKALPFAMRINLNGNGDPFFRKETRDFLINPKNNELYPNLTIDLVTNGLLFNEGIWERIKHNKFNSINVSCDGATKQTYENVRCNGKWEILLKNLKLISKLRKQEIFKSFSISFVVIKRNHSEMVRFIDVMSEFEPDEIRFQRVTGLIKVSENINFTKNIAAFSTIGNLLQDNRCKQKNVNTLALDFCKAFRNTEASVFDKARTNFLILLFSIPMRNFYKLRRHLVPLYHLYYNISLKLGR